MPIFLSILPIIIILTAGWLTVATGYIKRPDWEGVETLSFRFLIPIMIFDKIITSNLSAPGLGNYIFALLAATALIGALVLSLRWFLSKTTLPNAKLTSIFQLSVRFNIFVSFAVADQLFDANIMALLAIAMAFFIPFNNITVIPIMVLFGTSKATFNSVLKGLATNPLVVSSVLALALNFLHFHPPKPVLEALDFTAQAALGIGLLTIGAAIQIRRLMRLDLWVALSIVFKLFVSVGIFVGLAHWLALPQAPFIAGVLLMSAPAASNGYVVAKKMGGDAELYAIGLTWQTVLCGLSIPFWLWVLQLA